MPKIIRTLDTSKMKDVDCRNFELPWRMDPKGYVLIRIDRKKKLLELGFCKKIGKLMYRLYGKKPKEISHKVLDMKLISKMEHAAYIERELYKAWVALQLDLKFTQDSELNFRKIKKLMKETN